MTTTQKDPAPRASRLGADDLQDIHAFWRACNYLALGMIYLQDNPLLRRPLLSEHIKNRLLGHWGASPALSFAWTHLNRVIKRHDLDAIFLAGPGHGAPGVLAPVYLEGSYSEVYPEKGLDEEGLKLFFRDFSFPGGIGSHCTPDTLLQIYDQRFGRVYSSRNDQTRNDFGRYGCSRPPRR